jgi:L,D-transpeptidase ErfK/SrfK
MNIMQRISSLKALAIILSALITTRYSYAETFPLSEGNSVIGELRETKSRHEDTLIDIAREFNLGYDQIVKANPSVNRWLPGDGNRILLPTKYILPDAAHNGIVVNIAELRLYYYVPRKADQPQSVVTYPVSIGRMDWKTPLGETVVVRKEKDPAWYPTASIKAEHARDGDPLPDVIPGGHPENPLGGFALRLGIPGYLIHGVDERKANGIGMRVTHGCMRMYPEDVARLFEIVPVKTRVMLVNQPIKISQEGDKVLLQVITPLHEDGKDGGDDLSIEESLNFIRSKVSSDIRINEEKAVRAIKRGDGLTVVIAGPGSSITEARSSSSREDRFDRSIDDNYRSYNKPSTPERRYDYDESGNPSTANMPYRGSVNSDQRRVVPQVGRTPRGSARSGSAYRDEYDNDRDSGFYQQQYDRSRGYRPDDRYQERSSRQESSPSRSSYGSPRPRPYLDSIDY